MKNLNTQTALTGAVLSLGIGAGFLRRWLYAAALDEKGLLVEIAYCPAVKHLLKTGREVTPWYRYTTEVIMEVFAEKCGCGFVMDAYDDATGKAQYRFVK